MQEFIPYIIGVALTLGLTTAFFVFRKPQKRKLLKQHNALSQEDSLACFQQLKDYVKHRKPYLETPLTLKDVAARMELPLHYLSQAV